VSRFKPSNEPTRVAQLARIWKMVCEKLLRSAARRAGGVVKEIVGGKDAPHGVLEDAVHAVMPSAISTESSLARAIRDGVRIPAAAVESTCVNATVPILDCDTAPQNARA